MRIGRAIRIGLALCAGALCAQEPTGEALDEIHREYSRRSARLEREDWIARLALARWCREKELAEEARLEALAVLDVRPDLEDAYHFLGYVQQDGIWMSQDDDRRHRGWIRFSGRWVPPSDYPAAQMSAWVQDLAGPEARKAEAARLQILSCSAPEWGPVLRRWIGAQNPAVHRVVRLALWQIHDPDSVRALAGQFLHAGEDNASWLELAGAEGDPAFLKELFTRVNDYLQGRRSSIPRSVPLRLVPFLRQQKSSLADVTLFCLAVGDADVKVREAASSVLIARKDPWSKRALAAALKSPGVVRARSAWILGEMGDSGAVGPLIASLERVLAHKRADPEEMRDAFGFNFGGVAASEAATGVQLTVYDFLIRLDSPMLPIKLREMPAEVAALEKLTGQSFGKNAAQWRRWHEEKLEKDAREKK